MGLTSSADRERLVSYAEIFTLGKFALYRGFIIAEIYNQYTYSRKQFK